MRPHRRPRRLRDLGLWLLLALVAASALGSFSIGQPAVAAAESGGRPIMLILDASGSMVRDAPGGGTRMDQARAAATSFVESLSDAQPIGLMVFGTGTGSADSDRAAGCQDVRQLVQVGPLDKSAMVAQIGGIRESGYTPIGESITRAAAALGDGPASIVIVSDGVDTCAPPPSCERAAQLRTEYPLLTIHAIGFAVDADEQAQEELNCVARVGGGTYVTASNSAQLSSQLKWAIDPELLAGTVAPGGVNGLQLGMTLEEAQAAEPGLRVSGTVGEYVIVECDYAYARFRDGTLYDIYPREAWPTAEGLAVGERLAEADAIYGAASSAGTGDLGAFSIYPVSARSPYGYRVYADGAGVIVRIVLCRCGPGAAAAAEQAQAGTASRRVQAGFDGIGGLRLGMTAEEALAARPELAIRHAAEGMEGPADPFTPELAAGGDVCPMTASPYATDEIPIEALFAEGRLRALLVSISTGVATAGGFTAGSSFEVFGEAFPGARMSRTDEFGSQWISADERGTTVQARVSASVVPSATLVVADPDYTFRLRPRDWIACDGLVPRVER